MKKLILASLFFAFGSAHASCTGEAQIISTVDAVISKSLTSCVVSVKDVRFYAENQTCPLDLAQVMNSGIEIGFSDGHDCSLNPGDTLTGVIFIDQDGKIRL